MQDLNIPETPPSQGALRPPDTPPDPWGTRLDTEGTAESNFYYNLADRGLNTLSQQNMTASSLPHNVRRVPDDVKYPYQIKGQDLKLIK